MAIDKDRHGLKTDAKLRRQAEKKLNESNPKSGISRPDAETERLLHELQIHQIELEMQNSELQLTREELETALEKYTDLYDFAPVGYFTFNCKGVISSVNLTGAGILGTERAGLLGRRFGLFLTEETQPLFSEFIVKVFEKKSKTSCEVSLKSEGNPSRVMQIDAVVFGPDQECNAVVMDITARRKAEAALQQACNELTFANIDLEAFNYSVSHDLRSPLTVINGYCQMVQESCDSSLNEPCRGYLREMHDGTLRMTRLIDTLLDFSSITRIEMRHDNVNLSKIAEEVALLLKVSDPERRVAFRITDGITVDGDAVLLRSVLDNLIGNAWKYSGNREIVVIEFGATEIDGKSACFVKDNGPGFDRAHLSKLFIPFQRLPGTNVEGHGIGLATVDRIIRRHGGKVWAEVEPGKGACFYFTLGAA